MIVWKFLMITLISLGTAALYRVPRKLIPWCGLLGGVSGSILLLFGNMIGSIFATFIAAFLVGILSEFLARLKRVPVSIFLVPGFIPLVPGRYGYLTMRNFVEQDMISGLKMLSLTLFLAGAIAFGIFLSGTFCRILLQFGWRKNEL